MLPTHAWAQWSGQTILSALSPLCWAYNSAHHKGRWRCYGMVNHWYKTRPGKGKGTKRQQVLSRSQHLPSCATISTGFTVMNKTPLWGFISYTQFQIIHTPGVAREQAKFLPPSLLKSKWWFWDLRIWMPKEDSINSSLFLTLWGRVQKGFP